MNNKYMALALLDIENSLLALGIIFISAYFHNYWLLFLLLIVGYPQWIKEKFE